MRVREFSHYAPDAETTYFKEHTPVYGKAGVCIVLPFFNEEEHELQRSLVSLYEQQKECEDPMNTKFYYVVVLDGWSKASATMKNYLCQLFPPTKSDWVSALVDESKPEVMTFILENPELTTVARDVHLDVTLVLKKDNRRKANSHEWFFGGFVPHYQATYAFATDCGTLYAPMCLYNLIDYLDHNPDTIVVTGRQRVMSAEMQNVRNGNLMTIWYRACQAYDYEASISSFQGAFSLVGMLPVIPGPCGLYRVSDLRPALDHYFEVVNSKVAETGVLLGNMLLAEDRILSYAAVFFTGKFSRWVPAAVFYFEAETKSANFIAQRRRWINGSFASYIYLLWNSGTIIQKSSHSWTFRYSSLFLLSLQCLTFFITIFTPAMFTAIICNAGVHSDNEFFKTVTWSCGVAYGIMYVIFSLGHYRRKFMSTMFHFIVLVNCAMVVFLMSTVVVNYFVVDPVVIISSSIIMFFPFLLSLLHSFDVFMMMIFNFVPFMFFVPTFIAWFSAYSMARLWDMSWGNRPSDLVLNDQEANMDVMKRLIKAKGLALVIASIIANFMLFLLLVNTNPTNAVYVSIAMTVPTVIQQCMSFCYYMFVSSHLLTTMFDRCSKRCKRAVGTVLLLMSIGCLVVAMITPNWLTTTVDVIEDYNFTVTDIHRTVENDNNVCNYNELHFGNAWDAELRHCYYMVEEDSFQYDRSTLNVLDIFNGSTQVRETRSLLGYMPPNEGLTHNYVEFYFNKSFVSVDDKLVRVENNIYARPINDPKQVIIYPFHDMELAAYGNLKFQLRREVRHNTTYLILNRTGYVQMGYGIMYLQFMYFQGANYRNETMVWGGNPIFEWPNVWWTVTLCLVIVAIVFMHLVLLSILYTICITDRSRVKDTTVMFLWMSFAVILVAVLMFQVGLQSMKTYLLGWWHPDHRASNAPMVMCGNTDYFNSGDCALGYSYFCLIFALFPLNLAYNIFKLTVRKSNERKFHREDEPFLQVHLSCSKKDEEESKHETPPDMSESISDTSPLLQRNASEEKE